MTWHTVVCHGLGLWSEGNFRELFLSCLPVWSGDGTQAYTKPPLSAVPELLRAFHFKALQAFSLCHIASTGQADRLIVYASLDRQTECT